MHGQTTEPVGPVVCRIRLHPLCRESKTSACDFQRHGNFISLRADHLSLYGVLSTCPPLSLTDIPPLS